ncbi:hypothetical protein E3G52_000314 [Mycobacteroides abscessus]|nr:hypothetical protein [Mycobacteroides abscessus]
MAVSNLGPARIVHRYEAKQPGVCDRCGFPYLVGDMVETRQLVPSPPNQPDRAQTLCENCRYGWKAP